MGILKAWHDVKLLAEGSLLCQEAVDFSSGTA